MFETLQQVFRDVSPYRLVADLGIPIHSENDGFWFFHTKLPNVKIHITDREFVTASFENSFVAGNILDFLCLHYGDYLRGVDHMVERYGGNNLAEMDIARFAKHLTAVRARFVSWMVLRTNLLLNLSAYAPAVLWLKRHGSDAEQSSHLLYAVTGKKLKLILENEVFTETAPDLEPAAIYMVLPYFSNYHTISSITIKHTKDPIFEKSIQFHPARFSYFGLHSLVPGVMDCRVSSSVVSALSHHSFLSETGRSKFGSVHVRCDLEQYHEPLKIARGVYLLNSSNPIQEILKIRPAFGVLETAQLDRAVLDWDKLETTPWKSFIYSNFVSFAGDGKTVSPALLGFIENLKHDQETLDWFLGLLANKFPKLRSQIDTAILSRDVSMFGGIQITDTEVGLFASRGKPGSRVQFTNFTIKFDRSIWFESTEEIFYSGQVLFNGAAYPVKMSRAALSRPADIEQIACTAVLPGLQEGGKGTPSILDITFKSKLSAHLIRKSANASRVTGIDFLGWDRLRSKFTAPLWQADAYGVHPTSGAGHPGIDHFNRHYTFKRLVFVEDSSLVPAEAKGLIAILFSAIARGFLNLPCPTIPVFRSPNSNSLIRSMFVPFGQSQAIELNPNARYDIHKDLDKCACDYPAYGYGAVLQGMAENGMMFPFFFLGGKGLTFNIPISNEVHHQIYSLVYRSVTRMITGMLQDRNKAGLLITSENADLPGMVLEGNRLFAQYCDPQISSFAVTELPLFHQFLSQIPVTDIGKYCYFDLANQTVNINTRQSEDVGRLEITKELKAFGVEAETSGKHHITVPAEALSKILKKVYGQDVQFFSQYYADKLLEEAEDIKPSGSERLSAS